MRIITHLAVLRGGFSLHIDKRIGTDMGGRGVSSMSASARYNEGRRVDRRSNKGDRILTAGWLGIEGNRTSESMSVEHFRSKTLVEDHEFGGYFDESGFPLIMREGAKGSVAFAYGDEKGAASFIHNHPQSFGGTFSHNDVYVLLEDYRSTGGKMKTIYATAQEGVYRMSVKNQHSDIDGFRRAFDRACKGKNGLDARFGREYKEKGRRAACEIYHEWYKKHARKYGIEYDRS